MSSLTKQFSLSLELTRLAPLGLAASNAVMGLARSLKNSGSDIVIEEDVAAIFGRFKIAPLMERAFRTIVGKSHSTLLNGAVGLTLEDGPGPTVLRGLTQKPYFAMVIHCSLLTFIHEKNSLAAAIAQVCEREAEDTRSRKPTHAVPSHEAIYAVLQACEDQTSTYDWSGLLLATANTLGISEENAFETIPSIILQGATHMFSLVQSLPEDRIVLIDASEDVGICSLVVWAHHILGLTVLVRNYGPQHQGLMEKQIGSGVNNVVIDLRTRSMSWTGNETILEIKQPSITLLSVSENEPLLILRSDPDEWELDAVYKRPALGFGKRVLESQYPNEEKRGNLTRELMGLVVALATNISTRLYKKSRSSFPGDSSLPQDKVEGAATGDLGSEASMTINDIDATRKCECSGDAIIRSARFLFDIPDLSKRSFEGYIVAYSQEPFDDNMEVPHTISLLLDQHPQEPAIGSKDVVWQLIVGTVRCLSVLVLAFSFVKDLEACADLPLCQKPELLSGNALARLLKSWNGKSKIWIPEDCWFLVLAKLTVGHKASIDTGSLCLVSDRGWSIFLETFGNADPTYTDAGFVTVKKGVPCRNGVWKHFIIDGPGGGWDNEWHIVNSSGNKESLRCLNSVYSAKPLCGDQHDNFVITLRLSINIQRPQSTRRTGLNGDQSTNVATRRTGYREMFAAIWGAQRTRPCPHECSSISLPLSCVSVSGFGDHPDLSDHGRPDLKETARVVICLTANNPAARWRALLAIYHFPHNFPTIDCIKQIMLRGEDCCLQCAVDQTLVESGHWFLVL